ncbi:hypothetical protein GYMLUDRAFT_843880 [Collybiopsis luxurians FD-317 M1]|uniref:Uncharacterized protein n=1 Tax=Collybiopsis luxurians FD-317 M1 TaxID=944289 RepID=A0A0D0BZL8_9AGAR|nr:hypothetical protein GYMLUDRAFT_843880 [Collybiopsis luxurians FD-317 M1]
MKRRGAAPFTIRIHLRSFVPFLLLVTTLLTFLAITDSFVDLTNLYPGRGRETAESGHLWHTARQDSFRTQDFGISPMKLVHCTSVGPPIFCIYFYGTRPGSSRRVSCV